MWVQEAAAATAKLLQSCPTLCNPMSGLQIGQAERNPRKYSL